RADCQTIQAIGEVHRVGSSDNHQDHEENIEVSEIRSPPFDKWKVKARVIVIGGRGKIVQKDTNKSGTKNLKSEFLFCLQTKRTMLLDFQIVIKESDGTEANRYKQQDSNKKIEQISPQQSRDQDARQDQEPTHGRCSCLLLMRGRTFLPDLLANLKIAQFPDGPAAKKQDDEHSGHGGGCGSKGDVLEERHSCELG